MISCAHVPVPNAPPANKFAESVQFFTALLVGIGRNRMYAALEASHMPLGEQDLGDQYEQHHRRVFELCRCLLNSSDAAEDATHEVFVRAYRKKSTQDTSRPVLNWLLGIARHYCIDVLRRRAKDKRLFHPESSESFDPPSSQPSPLVQLLSDEAGKQVRKALRTLPDKYRVPLVLAYCNQLSYAEIAMTLGVDSNAVATLLFRGKRRLRERIERERRSGLPQ